MEISLFPRMKMKIKFLFCFMLRKFTRSRIFCLFITMTMMMIEKNEFKEFSRLNVKEFLYQEKKVDFDLHENCFFMNFLLKLILYVLSFPRWSKHFIKQKNRLISIAFYLPHETLRLFLSEFPFYQFQFSIL